MSDSPLVTEALALARSTADPGPDLPAGSATVPLRGEALPVPACLDRTLRLSLAGDRLRPAPSAGALHPVDTYVLLGTGCGLPPGLYAYDPARHRLHRHGPAPDPAPAGAFAVLGVTARRTVSHYGHRAWPLVLLDAGHAAAALALAGAHAVCLDADGGLLSEVAGGVPVALAAVQLLPGDPVALARWAEDPSSAVSPPWAQEPPGCLRTALRVLGELTDSGERLGTWRTVAGQGPDDFVLLTRRSASPGFHGVPSNAVLARILAAAETASPAGPRWCLAVGGPRPGLLTSRPPAASAGGGAAPGGPAAYEDLVPRRGRAVTLHRLASGDVLPTLAHWAARQGWIARAGAVLLAYGCPAGAPGARVRHDHLAAGYGIGHAQAAATAAGVPSRPVGSWQGADLGAALGGPAGQDWVVHGLALGRSPGGGTPQPTAGRSAGPATGRTTGRSAGPATGRTTGRSAGPPTGRATGRTNQGDEPS